MTRLFLTTIPSILSKSLGAAVVLIFSFGLSSQALAQADGQRRWQATIEAAKKEGMVVVAASPSPQTRLEFEPLFAKQFGVQLQYLALGGAEASARVEREAVADRATIDILLSGNTELLSLHLAGRFIPVKDKLMLPEVLDLTKWREKRLKFNDREGEYFLQTMEYIPADLVVNASALKPESINSWKDLLKPEFTGKICSFDPRLAGQGQSVAAYLLELFGPDFIKQLYVGQKVVYTGDRRQVGDWVARGTYPIALAVATREMEDTMKLGVPLVRVFPRDGPGALTGGSSVIKLIKNAPHPNAAVVFLNWFLTKQPQEIFHRTNGMVSRRTDADLTGVPSYIIPKKGSKYDDKYTYEYTIEYFPKTQKMLRDLFGGR